ncbi:MAG: M48 family metalloprotease [Desulfobaccales bacterium]
MTLRGLRIMALTTGVLLLAGFRIPSLPVPSEAGKALQVGGKTVQKAAVAAREISDSEEYYVGRAVAARILAKYSLSQNQEATRYINQVGQAVARKSSRPSTYRGYHFGILETSEPNAFACPGGIILITRGLIKECQNEDELAAVLAHEVAHIAHRDGINSISRARLSQVLTTAGTEAAKQYAGGVAGSLVSLFEGAIDDVFKTIVVNGYSRSAEEAADRDAVTTLRRAGYDPGALVALLTLLSARGPGGGGIFRTHPPTSQRLSAVQGLVGQATAGPKEQVRAKRFQQVRF